MRDAALSAPPTPFKGLAPYGESELDMLLFFGREREIEVIAANLVASRLTVLYGPSGVGKTSLLRAGVVTRLRRDEAAGVVVHANWSGDSSESLLPAIEEEGRRVRPDIDLDLRGRSLAEAMAHWDATIGAELYVVLDQFEEHFLYHESGGPFEELAEIIRGREHRANFLISIREDALAQLDAFKTQIPNLFGNSLRLDRLDRHAAMRAIRGPLERYNELAAGDEPVVAEDELVEEILDSVRAGRIQLGPSGRGGAEEAEDGGRIEAPYLQLVLERMWNVERERGSTRLRLRTLRELGGATRIVEEHLERAMSILSPEEQDAAAAMYNHLVTPSGTKIAHRAGDLARYASVDEAEAGRVLDRLVRERIVRAAEDGAAGPQYEIFHDVLADAVLAWRTRHEAESRLAEERARAARRYRRLLLTSAASLAAVAVLAGIAVYALSQRSSAQQSAREARAGELVALAAAVLPTNPEKSLEHAVAASRIARSLAVEATLRTALKELRAEAVIPLGGPSGEITLGADGSLVAQAGNGEVRMFRDRGDRFVRALRHPQVTSAEFSESGARLATVGRDGVARIWDTRDGRLVQSLRPGGPIGAASFSRDGGRILTVSERRDVRVFDLANGEQLVRFVQPSDVMAARFSPSGDRIATGGPDRLARLWDARTGKLRLTLTGHEGRVGDVAFSPDGELLATGSTDGTGRVWKTDSGSPVSVLPGHGNFVSRVDFSPTGDLVATGSHDRRARIFDADSSTLRATLVGHDEAVTDLAWSHDAQTLTTASTDGTVRRWDALERPRLAPVREHREAVVDVGFSADGGRVISATRGRSPLAAQPVAARPNLVAALNRASSPTAVALDADGRRAVSGHADGTVGLWDAVSGRRIHTLAAHRGAVTSVAFSPDGRLVATTSVDKEARVSDAETGAQVWELAHTGPVSDAAFSADGRWVAIAGPGEAGIVDAQSGERVLLVDGQDRLLTAVAFSPSGWRIATGGEAGAVKTYGCELCGAIDELVALAERRLSQLRPRS